MDISMILAIPVCFLVSLVVSALIGGVIKFGDGDD